MIFVKISDIIQKITPTKFYPMSTDTEAPISTKSALEFKSSSFSVPVLVISRTELNQIKHQLKEKIAQAPEFFKNSPLLIDLKNCNNEDQPIDLPALIQFLQSEKLLPIGLSNGNEEQNITALKHHIPVHTIRSIHTSASAPAKSTLSINDKTTANETVKETVNTVENMLISQPIRSGQRIYAKGDLTILSHVSAGAEIMAEGNIHVYGALRGRALAGVQGNPESRIFCSALQAELVSIAGHYKTSEELNIAEQKKPTQIFLQDQALIIEVI
jgi:septum site-determining protein MinC